MKLKLNKYFSYLFVLFLGLSPTLSFALGGLDQATSIATEIKTWLYSFIGVCAVLYLLFKIVRVWSGQENWMQFITAIGHVAIAGGIPALAVFAWGFFGS